MSNLAERLKYISRWRLGVQTGTNKNGIKRFLFVKTKHGSQKHFSVLFLIFNVFEFLVIFIGFGTLTYG